MADPQIWDAVVRIDTKSGKPYWHTIGRAWASTRNPGSIKLKLNSLPVGNDLYLFPHRERSFDARVNLDAPGDAHWPDSIDDDCPF